MRDWEPFYVAVKDTPDFDERLTWNGRRDKIVLVRKLAAF